MNTNKKLELFDKYYKLDSKLEFFNTKLKNKIIQKNKKHFENVDHITLYINKYITNTINRDKTILEELGTFSDVSLFKINPSQILIHSTSSFKLLGDVFPENNLRQSHYSTKLNASNYKGFIKSFKYLIYYDYLTIFNYKILAKELIFPA